MSFPHRPAIRTHRRPTALARVALLALSLASLASAACMPPRPVAPGLPSRAALVEVRFAPARTVMARSADGDSVALPDVARLTGRLAMGSTADTLVLVPGSMLSGADQRDVGVRRGLVVRVPNGVGGVTMQVHTEDTRPGQAAVAVAIGVGVAAILYYLAFVLSDAT